MDKYQVFRVETDTGVVASVVVACCQQDQKFYAEYLVLLPHSEGCRSWHHIETVPEDQSKEILQDAWEKAKQKMISKELSNIFQKQHDGGDVSDFDGYFTQKYRTEMAKLHDEVKCQCLKNLLSNK